MIRLGSHKKWGKNAYVHCYYCVLCLMTEKRKIIVIEEGIYNKKDCKEYQIFQQGSLTKRCHHVFECRRQWPCAFFSKYQHSIFCNGALFRIIHQICFGRKIPLKGNFFCPLFIFRRIQHRRYFSIVGTNINKEKIVYSKPGPLHLSEPLTRSL